MKTLLTITIIVLLILGILVFSRWRYDNLVKKIWLACQTPGKGKTFTPEMVADLPQPVQKYFLHAIAPGTPLAECVQLEMKGDFRSKPQTDWLPMTASQIISTFSGFVWRAKVGKGLNNFSGADYFHDGKGRMRFFLWGLIPVVDAQNENIARSAIGRLAGEYALWLPSALLPQNGVVWDAISEDTIQANFQLNKEPITLVIKIDPDGKPLEISFLRWRELAQGGKWQYIPFWEKVMAEKTCDLYTIPSVVIGGWQFEDRDYFEFLRATITQAQFS